jgi:hypothetical protein
MKKNISNYEALLISLASDGDCTAFHSLIIHHLSAWYLKLIEEGLSHSDASAKLCATGANLFRSFIGQHPANFESWMIANGESNNNSEHEFLPSNKTEHKQKLFSNELHLHLQRLSSSLNHQKKKKHDILRFFTNSPVVAISLILLIILCTSIPGFLFFSHSAIKLQLINKTTEHTLLFVGAKPQIIPVSPVANIQIVDSSKTDTIPKTSLKIDTVVKVKERPIQPKKAALVNGTENQISRNSSGSQSGSYRSTENSSVSTTSTVELSPATPSPINSNESSGNQNNYQRQPIISADSNSNRYH